jgi:hypothetical protein
MTDLRALNVIASATLTVSNTAVGLDSATPALVNGRVNGKTVRRAVISIKDAAIRWRSDAAPTATVGHPIDDGGTATFTGANYKTLLSAIKFIRQASTDAELFISYFD